MPKSAVEKRKQSLYNEMVAIRREKMMHPKESIWLACFSLAIMLFASCGGGDVTGPGSLDAVAEEGVGQQDEGFYEVPDGEAQPEETIETEEETYVDGEIPSFECTSIEECDDQNECTLDLCIDNHCVHRCLTGLSCGSENGVSRCRSERDRCECVKIPECEDDSQCNDMDPCTKDICVENRCVHTCDVGAHCSDGNPDTSMDSCVAEGDLCVCKGIFQGCLEDKDCDDGNQCTLDRCVDGRCVNECQVDTSCDDHDPDTDNDACREGPLGCVCIGKKECYSDEDCDDINDCTIDYCDEHGKCRHVCFEGRPCSDGNPGTENDVCASKDGACLCIGIPIQCTDDKDCDDQDPCTRDRCLNSVCVSECLVGTACDDGNMNTSDDTCKLDRAGRCICSGEPECFVDADCDDSNPCTTDVCLNGGCEHECLVDSECDDGNGWTYNDICVITPFGTCVCQGEQAECQDKIHCDDNNPCTEDQCINFLCHHNCLEGILCDDGNPDTLEDKCGWLEGPSPSCVCQGRYECTEDTDCDDKNPCTIDRCQNNHCYHECDVGQLCSGDWPLPMMGYCLINDGMCGCFPPNLVCDDPYDCPPTQYCHKDDKMCGSLGVCEDRPPLCPLVYQPVCGCDGRTYTNRCEAYAAGTSVWYEGECEPVRCFDNSMCPEDQYCSFVPCAIETGVCIPRPELCLPEYEPVCGCDKETYGNACEAALHGVSVDYIGPCRECRTDSDCDDGNPCTRDFCYQFHCEYDCLTGMECSVAGQPGAGICVLDASGCRCELAPECYADEDCDDMNECTIDLCVEGKCQHECNIGSRCGGIFIEGTCKEVNGLCECIPLAQRCTSNLDCPKSAYCRFEPGTCAPPGVCVLRPLMCPDVIDPVCGCDRVTYQNECFAAQAGVSILHEGECEGVPECTSDRDCDDSNQCTTDTCVEGRCEYKCNVDERCIIDLDIPIEGKCKEEFGSCGCVPEGVQSCASNADCLQNQYCQFQLGTCEPPGACIDKPSMCLPYNDPVCGCDGVTYINACYAAMAGVSIRYFGACKAGL